MSLITKKSVNVVRVASPHVESGNSQSSNSDQAKAENQGEHNSVFDCRWPRLVTQELADSLLY